MRGGPLLLRLWLLRQLRAQAAALHLSFLGCLGSEFFLVWPVNDLVSEVLILQVALHNAELLAFSNHLVHAGATLLQDAASAIDYPLLQEHKL